MLLQRGGVDNVVCVSSVCRYALIVLSGKIFNQLMNSSSTGVHIAVSLMLSPIQAGLSLISIGLEGEAFCPLWFLLSHYHKTLSDDSMGQAFVKLKKRLVTPQL